MKRTYSIQICKNCGKEMMSKFAFQLCSIPCIKEWMEEEHYYESLLKEKK